LAARTVYINSVDKGQRDLQPAGLSILSIFDYIMF
jgi:hypothetical protein